MHSKAHWALLLVLAMAVMMCETAVADEGVHRTWISIGEPDHTPGGTCDACWDQLVALELQQHYRQTIETWRPNGSCVDWSAFQTNVLPLIAAQLSLGADRFAAMIDTVYEMSSLMEQVGTLELWEDTARDVAGWPILPSQFPWLWPWPNCIFFSYALRVGGIAESAAEEIARLGAFNELVVSQPEILAAILAEAVLDAADLVSAPSTRSTVERIATSVVPELLTRLVDDSELLLASQLMLEKWGEDSESDQVVSVLIPYEDPFDSEQYEIRDWMDYVQTAAAVIAAGAAIAACCM